MSVDISNDSVQARAIFQRVSIFKIFVFIYLLFYNIFYKSWFEARMASGEGNNLRQEVNDCLIKCIERALIKFDADMSYILELPKDENVSVPFDNRR